MGTPFMSAETMIASYSDRALEMALDWLDSYRPEPMERDWCEKRKAMIREEMKRRAAEDAEGAR